MSPVYELIYLSWTVTLSNYSASFKISWTKNSDSPSILLNHFFPILWEERGISRPHPHYYVVSNIPRSNSVPYYTYVSRHARSETFIRREKYIAK